MEPRPSSVRAETTSSCSFSQQTGDSTVTPYAGAIRDFLGDLSQRHGVWVLGGYAEPGDADGRARNACALFDPQGDEQLRYRKIAH